MRTLAILLAIAAVTPALAVPVRVMDPPAADSDAVAFFVQAARHRPAPPGLARSTGATLMKAARFLMSDTGIDSPDALRDESGRNVPPYTYHAVIDDDNRFRYRIAYPAFHHAYLVEAFLNHYNYTGNGDALRRARQLADWTIAHSTPADWKLPYLPWSTFSEGKPGGLEDRDTLQPDKVGYMGLAYTRLYEVTGERQYFDAARRAADTLVAQQRGDGSWPFRVNPQTGAVYQEYTAALFMNAAFLEKMHALTRNLDYKNGQLAAWMWMLRNPLRTNNWSGLYEDIPKGSGSQVHYSPAQTIRLLLRWATPVNRSSYMAKARALFDYTMDGLAFHDREMGLVLREQTDYLAATPSSALNWSMMAAEFYLATGEERYRQATLEAVRLVTRHGLKPDGRTHNTVMGGRVYGNFGSWYSLGSPVVRYLYQDMGCLPELAPEGETHLLRTSTQVRRIAYAPRAVDYETLADSVDLLKVATPPTSVTAGGRAVRPSKSLRAGDGWLYNPRSRVLVVRHGAPRVRVTLAGR